MQNFLDIHALDFNYGERAALRQVSMQAPQGAFVALLGPNGSGKTTLFHILSGMRQAAAGSADIFGHPISRESQQIRRKLGIVFQSPSLDDKLSVKENLRHHGHLYGLWGGTLRQRIDANLKRFDLEARGRDRIGTLSGGLQRRVELARALLHMPSGLLLDEPTTGLDPSVRLDFWALLEQIRREQELSVLFTTHWFEEAERANLVGILDGGRLVAFGEPKALKSALGTEIVTITASHADKLAAELSERLNLRPGVKGNCIRFGDERGPELVADIMTHYGTCIETITAGRPTLEDVYIHHTGKPFAGGSPS